MLLPALFEYLTYSGNVPGHAEAPFAFPQWVDGRKIEHRNDARRHIRDMVGQSVYEARIPQNRTAATAITLRAVSGNVDLPLVGETGLQMDIVELGVWTRGPSAAHVGRIIGRLCRIALSNYFGWLDWQKSTWSHAITIEREGEFITPPFDGSDVWPAQFSMDLNCGYTVAAAVYPDESLQAIASVRKGVGSALIISAKLSHVPEGRPLTNVAFTVRDSQGGNVVKSWGGAPTGLATGTGISGLNVEATVTGLPSSGWVDLVITDKFGTTSATGVPYAN